MKRIPRIALLSLILFVLPRIALGLPIHSENPSGEYIADCLSMPEGGFLLVGNTGFYFSRPLIHKIDGEGRTVWETKRIDAEEAGAFPLGAILDDGYIRLWFHPSLPDSEVHRVVALSPDGAPESAFMLPSWTMDVAFAGDAIYAVGILDEAPAICRVNSFGDVLWMRHATSGLPIDDTVFPDGFPFLPYLTPAKKGLLVYSDAWLIDGPHPTGLLLYINEDGSTRFTYKANEADRITSAYELSDGRIIGIGTRSTETPAVNFVFCLSENGTPLFEQTLSIAPWAHFSDILPLDEGFLFFGTSQKPLDPSVESTPVFAFVSTEGKLLSGGSLNDAYSHYSFIEKTTPPLVFAALFSEGQCGPWAIMPLETLLPDLSPASGSFDSASLCIINLHKW